jgi:hypothetical protein
LAPTRQGIFHGLHGHQSKILALFVLGAIKAESGQLYLTGSPVNYTLSLIQGKIFDCVLLKHDMHAALFLIQMQGGTSPHQFGRNVVAFEVHAHRPALKAIHLLTQKADKPSPLLRHLRPGRERKKQQTQAVMQERYETVQQVDQTGAES